MYPVVPMPASNPNVPPQGWDFSAVDAIMRNERTRLDAHGITTLDVTHALLPALLPLLALHARTGVHCGQAAPHFERKRLAH